MVHPDTRNALIGGQRFQCTDVYLKGMPKGKWLFSFQAPVPEDGFLAKMFAEKFEGALMKSPRFRSIVKRWRKN